MILRVSLSPKMGIGILMLMIGLAMVSGQAGQVYAAGHWGHGWGNHGGYHGGRYYGGGGYWFAPGYPVYPYPVYACPPGYVWNPYVYPYCFRAP